MRAHARVRASLAFIARQLHSDLSARRLAQHCGVSRYHWHRLFVGLTAETPKQFTARLRLNRAAALLLSEPHRSVRALALACGFASQEVFSRAFQRRFGMAPRDYRRRGWSEPVSAAQARAHARWLQHLDPCIRLFRLPSASLEEPVPMDYVIATKELPAQPILAVRRRVPHAQIAAQLGPMFGEIVAHAQRSGAALAGQPVARYLETGPALFTLEAGLPVASAAQGAGNVIADTLPAGLVAFTTHSGPYDRLPEAHAALERWIEAHGFRSAGARWELYVTDPADYPDPRDWRTEVIWPIAKAMA